MHGRIQDFRLGGALNLDGRSPRAPHLGVGGRGGGIGWGIWILILKVFSSEGHLQSKFVYKVI